jgi:phenylalanyl-tRNA synthetase alpha chain
LTKAVQDWAGLHPEVLRSSPIVSIQDNYDRLYYEADAVARSSRYSHYVDDTHILRTHTTAAVPGYLRETTDDRLMVLPGIVYRRDVMDKMHVGEPHQVDLWIVKQARLRRRDLEAMISAIMTAILPGRVYRCNETIHPYTVNGLEVEVQVGDRWVEVLECGEAHPWVLNDAGLSSATWSGLAMGIGLDRLVMLLKGVEDIRLLRSTDKRVYGQMQTMQPYLPVSDQPSAKRDLSIVVDEVDMELLGDKVRTLLGDRAEWMEEIIHVGDYGWHDVPDAARQRLGMGQDQRNLVIRLIMRSPTQSIPREVANEVYAQVYEGLHQGSTVGYR